MSTGAARNNDIPPDGRESGVTRIRFRPIEGGEARDGADDDQDARSAAVAQPVTARPTRRGGREARLLAQSVVLEEAGVPGLVRLTGFAIAAVVTAFVVWSAFTEVDEVANASGEVVPAGQLQAVQHLEGGIIADIGVADGDVVERGDILIRLDPAGATAELKQMRARLAGLVLQAERLRAFAEEREADFSIAGPDYADQAADQRAIFDIQTASRNSQRAVLENQMQQRESAVALFEEQEQTLKEVMDILKQELDIRRPLVAKGLTTRTEFLQVQREVTQAYGNYIQLQGEWQLAAKELAEARSRLAELETTLREQALSEMGGVSAELAQVREAVAKLEDRVNRLEIRAPVGGIVKGLQAHTVGGVLAPGAVVLEIVPMDGELVVETRVATTDVGHVEVGQPVTVKVLTYDYARYGGIPARLRSISASTFLDEEQTPYYKAVVELDRGYVGTDPARNLVLPGMTVQADIKTGRKTLLQYLLKPVYSSVNEAFRER